MSKTLAWIIVIAIIAFGIWQFKKSTKTEIRPDENVACTLEAKLCPDGSSVGREGPDCEFAACPGPQETTKPVGNPTFSWEYKAAERNDFPYSMVSLSATYPDGTIVRKELREVQGGCNDYSDPDKDVYKGKMIMCYFAGFGEYFKVVKTENGYEVRHKEFTEASPDYEAPEMEYETIAVF